MRSGHRRWRCSFQFLFELLSQGRRQQKRFALLVCSQGEFEYLAADLTKFK
jgi:hypothetical protein